jgi:hypothetical protein
VLYSLVGGGGGVPLFMGRGGDMKKHVQKLANSPVSEVIFVVDRNALY